MVGVDGQERRGEEEEELLVRGEIATEERLHWWNCSCLHCERSLPARVSLVNIKTRFVS